MSQELQVKADLLPVGSLDAYIFRVNAIPVLSREEEYDLARRLHEQGDLQAAQELILSQLRYVVRVARGYMGYGLPMADLIQEGTVGLMKAVKRFDPSFEVRLVTFAVHWIKAEIHDYVLKNWRIVKVATTKAQRKLFFNLRKAKKRLGWFTQDEINQVAADLGVTAKEVVEMEQRLNAHDACFNRSDSDDDEGSSYLPAPEQYLTSEDQDPQQQLAMTDSSEKHSQQLVQALQNLDPRSLDIIQNRYLSDTKSTLHELAAKYEVSAERIRQLEKNAIKKLRGQMLPEAGA